MAISHSDHVALMCPDCGSGFQAEVWLILDAHEQPEQVELLRHERLNYVTCPHCGSGSAAAAPLLLHDGMARRVIFAATPGAAEYAWREQARALHTRLVASIPVEQRRPYLEDVQIAQDVPGLAHILRKMARQTGETSSRKLPGRDLATFLPEQALSAPTQPRPVVSEPVVTRQDQAETLLHAAIQALIAADSPGELRAVVDTHPILLTSAADAAIAQLAEVAVEQREYTQARQFHRVRLMLVDLRAGDPVDLANYTADPHGEAAPAARHASTTPPVEVPAEVYQALLQAQSSAALFQAVQAYPLLLEPWIDDALSHSVNRALDEGNERLAWTLEERRRLLGDLHRAIGRSDQDQPAGVPSAALDPQVYEVVQALLDTDDADALARLLIAHPELLTGAAQAALEHFASEARRRGDEELAAYASECRVMLQQIRAEWEG